MWHNVMSIDLTTSTLDLLHVGEVEDTIPFLKIEFLGSSLYQYFLAFLALLVGFIGQRLIVYFIRERLPRLTAKTKTEIDDTFLRVIEKPVGLFAVLVGFFLAGGALSLPTEPNIRRFYFDTLKTFLAVDVAWLFLRFVDVLVVYLKSISKRTDTTLDDELLPIIRKTLKVFIALIAAVLILQNLGYSVTGLITGLGIGGLAVALAAQDLLSNVFGSFVIFTDRPFRMGDWIVAGDVEGVVEEVGFRSTKIRTFAKTLVTVPNKTIADLAIDNFSRMPKRRVKMTVGVTYETNADQMQQALAKIRELLRTHKGVDQNFFLVYFTEFGDSSLNILVYYFTVTTVWEEYLLAREEINLAIMRELEAMGLSIAFPTQTVYLKHYDDNTPRDNT